MKRGWRGRRGFDAQQLQLDWSAGTASPPHRTEPAPTSAPPENLTLRLKWDFRGSFPEPTEQAVEAGKILDEDRTPEGIRSIHEEHAREMLATLNDLDAVLDARRRGVDPTNGKTPRTEAARLRLQKLYETEPPRLEQWFENLLGAYADVFGAEAADAFGKAVRAWHAGVEVLAKSTSHAAPFTAATLSAPAPTKSGQRRDPTRISARLPVPRPLPSAVFARHFGQEDDGKPVRPGAYEVRAITEDHADKLIDLLDSIRSAPAAGKDALHAQYAAGIAAYCEDFGERAARQLDAYVRRQASLDPAMRLSR